MYRRSSLREIADFQIAGFGVSSYFRWIDAKLSCGVGVQGLKIITAGLAILAVTIHPASADTLHEAVRATIASHPRLEAAAHSRDAVSEELREARGLFLPEADVLVGGGAQTYDSTTTRANNTDKRVSFRKEASITITQRVFDGFEAASQVERQKARVASAAHRVAEAAEFLGLDAVNAYLEVWRQRRLLDIARDNAKVHRAMLGDLRQRAQSGGGSVADVSHAEARLARARATTLQTETDLRDAEALYRRVVGRKPGSLATPVMPAVDMPADEEAALRLLDSNPTVRIFQSDAEAARHEVAVNDAAAYPKVNLEVSHERYWDGADEDGELSDTKAMLRMRYNLYRGGADQARRRGAAARESQSRALLVQAGREAEEQMLRSWNAFDLADERIAALKQAMVQAAATRDAYREQFKVAQRTLIEVLDAENEYFMAAGLLATGEANRLSAAYRLLATGGMLLASMGVQRPTAADPAVPGFMQDLMR